MKSRWISWIMLVCTISMGTTAQAQLFEPAIDNPSFEAPDLGSGGSGSWEDYVEDWAINTSGLCYLEDGSWEIVAPNGVNVLKMWSGAAVWQQIGTWTANKNYEVGLWIGRGDSSSEVEVEFWVGGDSAAMPASAYGAIEDTVGATEIVAEALAPTVSTGESEWMTTVLNTGTGFTVGDALWIRIECIANSDEAAWIDDVQVGPVTNPALAKSPSPADGEDDVALDTSLSWTAGKYAVSHDIYFGTDFNDVNDASRTQPGSILVSQGQSDTSYTPEELVLDGEYYWRVDEVNADSSDIHKGTVWTFMAEPTYFDIIPETVSASSYHVDENYSSLPENTIDGSGLNNGKHATTASTMWRTALGDLEGAWIQYEFEFPYQFGQLHIWNYNALNENALGVGIKEALIETSMDGTTWTLLDEVELTHAPGDSSYTGETIDMNDVVAQFIRITARSQHGYLSSGMVIIDAVGLSEIQFQAAPLAARRPSPVDGQTLDSLFDELVWRMGRGAQESRLYVNTDANLVTEADANALIETTPERRFTIADTDAMYRETYAWRVDEVYSEKVVAGPVWTFSTPEALVIDDMESYTPNSGSIIYEAWSDGYGEDNGNGSYVGYDIQGGPYTEHEITFDNSGKSMPFFYEDEEDASSAWATLNLGGQNWSVGGLQTLVVYFLGDEGNDEATFFVDIDGQRIESPKSLQSPVWQQLAIEIEDLDIDLTSVHEFTIGVDGAGVEGMLLVDEIKIYRDVHVVESPVNPDDDGLVVYYNMESNVDNQIGSLYNGVAEVTLFYEGDSFHDDFGKSLIFDGVDTQVSIPDLGSLVSTLTDSSFSAWVSIDEEADGSWMRVFDFGTGTENYLFLSPRTETSGEVRAAILSQAMTDGGITEIGVTSGSSLSDGWHHVACVFDESLLTLYVDGWSAGSVETEAVPQDLGETTQNWLGESLWDGDDLLEGTMDEFRIYNRALSEGEIRYLAGDR